MKFAVTARDGNARTGVLDLPHCPVETPVFMPVGTAATVKALEAMDVWDMGYRLILANTYHLALRPGADVVESLGGLRTMMAYPGNILTDSGGYQVFSLAQRRTIDPDGITFQSHIDGARLRFTPQIVQQLQGQFGSTIAMPLDICPPAEADRKEILEACATTRQWFVRAQQSAETLLFGIVQGGTYADIRNDELRAMIDQDPVGIALGGFSVGEERQAFWDTLSAMRHNWPEEKPIYAMGVGDPRDLVFCSCNGVDMFDCVLPTRNARNGRLYVRNGYINVKRAQFQSDQRPVDPDCPGPCCRRYSIGYLRHLYISNELLYFTLGTMHNLLYFKRLMDEVRAHIKAGTAQQYCDDFLRNWIGNLPELDD